MASEPERKPKKKKSTVEEIDVLDFASNRVIGDKYERTTVEKVWEYLCKFIASSMYLKRGIKVPDLGVFTMFELANPTSATYYVFMHRPLFHMNKKLATSYDLKNHRLYASGNVPYELPNYTVIASLVPCTRFEAEDITHGIVTALRHLCKARVNLFLKMPDLGTLYVRNRYVDMRFSCEFVVRLHRNIINPARMVDAFQEHVGVFYRGQTCSESGKGGKGGKDGKGGKGGKGSETCPPGCVCKCTETDT